MFVAFVLGVGVTILIFVVAASLVLALGLGVASAVRSFWQSLVKAIRREPDPWGFAARRKLALEYQRDRDAKRAAARKREVATEKRRNDPRRKPPAGAYPGWWYEKIKNSGFSCVYCGSVSGRRGTPEYFKLVKEHDIPLARGGPHSVSNIVPACARCNLRKGTKTGREFRTQLAQNEATNASRHLRKKQRVTVEIQIARALRSLARRDRSRGWTATEILATLPPSSTPTLGTVRVNLSKMSSTGRIDRVAHGHYRVVDGAETMFEAGDE